MRNRTPCCNRCKKPVELSATGRPRRFCSSACKQTAYRKRAKRSVHFSSATPEWSTPADLFAEVDREFGFTLDVCATPENAKCPRYFTKEDNGLAQLWTGRVWMNPPYGREIHKWMAKAHEAAASGEAEIVVCLVPARTDTAWWHDYAMKGDEIRNIRGRLRFGGADSSAPFPSAVVVFRNAISRYETTPSTERKEAS